MMLLLAQLPQWPSTLTIYAVGVVVCGLVFFGALFLALRSVRSGLVDEVTRQQQANANPSPVAVQQPLVVKPHDGLVSISQHQQLQEQFDALTEQRRKDVHGLHNKIEEGLESMRKDIASEFKELRETQAASREQIAVLKNETATQTRQLHALDDKIEDLPEKILRLIDRKPAGTQ